jgi:hypothetical protein
MSDGGDWLVFFLGKELGEDLDEAASCEDLLDSGGAGLGDGGRVFVGDEADGGAGGGLGLPGGGGLDCAGEVEVYEHEGGGGVGEFECGGVADDFYVCAGGAGFGGDAGGEHQVADQGEDGRRFVGHKNQMRKTPTLTLPRSTRGGE